jgi:DNA-binding MarR family transcriptional regulator
LNTREIAAGVTSLVARLDGHNKGVYTPNMESEEVDFVACRQCVCTAARRRSRELTRLFEKAMRGSGVRGTQFTLLATLVQTGPLPTTRLADFQGLERTTLTRNLARLVRDGFVRIDEGEDRRVRKVAITPAGEEAARRAYPFWKKAQDAALAPAAPPSAPS